MAPAIQDLQGYAVNSSFDPYNQDIHYLMPDGITPTNSPIWTIFSLQAVITTTAVIYGVQVGMCSLLLLVLALLTKSEKRRSVIFLLNIAALLFLLLRGIFALVTLYGAFYNYFNWVTSYYTNVGVANRISVSQEVSSFLSIVAVELSLLFQVRIVCCTLRTRWRLLITAATILVALTVCAIRFATMVVNAQYGIVGAASTTEDQVHLISALGSATNISMIVSIIFFSAIFCAKLGHAIYRRRTMGMKQFGPMQIIFVMGCQTLVIPAIFGVLTYFAAQSSQVNSLMPVLVAVFLPLSGMWAATSTKADNISAMDIVGRSRKKAGKDITGASGTRQSEKRLVDDETLVDKSSPTKASYSGSSIDHDTEKSAHQIQVDRTFSVRSD